MDILIFTLIVLAAIAAFVWPWYQRKRAMESPFPAQWRQILRHNVPIYRRLPSDLQLQLQRLVKRFIHEKHFEGCAGLEMTDEIRVTIAGSACLLLLNRKTSVFGGLKYILVYPSHFITRHPQVDQAGLSHESPSELLGESWDNGKVILSWDSVVQGNLDTQDGKNVALHEFAHQLDAESGWTNGSPVLGDTKRQQNWSCILADEYARLQEAAAYGDDTLLDYYGATNPAEFFAVVTETFFEQAEAMAERHPKLFKQLHLYYQVDPRNWV